MSAPTLQRRFLTMYGLAHGGKSLLWHASELLFAYYLTEVCGISPPQAGVILCGSLVLSAFSDMAAGVALRQRVGSVSRAGAVQLFGAAFSSVAFAAFGLSSFVPQGPAGFTFALGTMLAFRLCYTLLDVPQNAMLALAGGNDAQRVQLASLRYVSGGIADVIVASAFAPLFRVGGVVAQSVNFALFAVLLAATCFSSSGTLWWYLRHPEDQRSDGPHVIVAHPPDSGVAPRTWPIFVILAVASAATSIFGLLAPYFAAYGTRSAIQGSTLLTAVALGTLVSQFFWGWLARKLTLLRTLRWSATALGASAFALAPLVKLGAVGVALGGGLYGWCRGGVLMSIWALAAAASTRQMRPTVVFGAMTCISKLAIAIATVAVTQILAAGPYRNYGAANVWLMPSMITPLAVASLTGLLLSLYVGVRTEIAPPNSRHCAERSKMLR